MTDFLHVSIRLQGSRIPFERGTCDLGTLISYSKTESVSPGGRRSVTESVVDQIHRLQRHGGEGYVNFPSALDLAAGVSVADWI